MNTYLAIITTVLVLTQVIRVVQNAIQLKKQSELSAEIPDITNEDIETQKEAYALIVEYLRQKNKQ